MAKRLRSIRRGIRYQDLVAAEAILDMVLDSNAPPDWVMLENRQGGSFDDVVVGYPDQVVWKQVKWSEHPGAEPLSVETFAELTTRRKHSLICAFADSYRKVVAQGLACRLEFVTNRSPDDEFRKLLHGTESRITFRLTTVQRQRIDTLWLPSTGLPSSEFKAFLKTLHFLVNSPDLDRLKRNLQRQLYLVGCGPDAFLVLMDEIAKWSEDEQKEQITRADVMKVLGTGGRVPSNEFRLPDKRVEREEAHEELARRVMEKRHGYLVVLGSPGSGKSTLLNTAGRRSRLSRENDVVVYNCFTGTSDNFMRTRACADNFARFLSRELRTLYRSQFPPMLQTEAGEIENLLERAARCGTDGRMLVLIIDGLDYARRFQVDGRSNLFDCLPPSPPQGVVIIVSAQVADQLPSHLQQLGPDRRLTVPSLDQAKVRELLAKYDLFDRAALPPHEEDDLCHQVLQKTAGHALHVNLVARQLDERLAIGEEALDCVERMPQSDGDIEAYYQSLFGLSGVSLRMRSIAVMAASPFELTFDEISEILGPSVAAHEIEDALRDFMFLFERTGPFLHFAHDSLRVFTLNRHENKMFRPDAQRRFLSTLVNDPRAGEHLLHLEAEDAASSPVLPEIDCDWFAKQIAAGTNMSLLQEGSRQLALSALERRNWRETSRWWCLLGCIERAEFEGQLDEATLVDTWLSMGNDTLVERYAFVTSQFLPTVYPGPDLIELLEYHGRNSLAKRLCDCVVTQTPPELEGGGMSFEFGRFIRHFAKRASPAEIVWVIQKAVEGHNARELARGPGFRPMPTPGLSGFAKMAAYECLDARDFDRLDEWLTLEPLPFDDSDAWDLWLRACVARRQCAAHRERVEMALESVEDVELLVSVLNAGGFREVVAQAYAEFEPPPLLYRKDWLSREGSPATVREIQNHVRLCCRLSLEDRLDGMKDLANRQPNPIACVFLLEIIAIVECAERAPERWQGVLQQTAREIRMLRRRPFGVMGVHAAQYLVGALGTILEPIVASSKEKHETEGLGITLEMELLPALYTARIYYEAGRLSLCDVLLAERICRDLAKKLVREVEDLYADDIIFKSGGLIGLSSLYTRLGDKESAHRVLASGVRAAFTYGYHKDTTINEFIVAFERIGSELANRLPEVAEFIARDLLLLDRLTDGRMLYDAPAHFVAILCKFDIPLAARLAESLRRQCRSLNLGTLAHALQDHGVDIDTVRVAFKELAPTVEFNDFEEDEHPRAYFVTSDQVLDGTVESICAELADQIANSSFGAAFHTIPALIEALISQGDSQAAVAVFEEFESALRQLTASYPLPRLECESTE
jgi:AAA ATPase-like protein